MKVIGETNWILSREAGKAKACPVQINCLEESFKTQIMQGIKSQEFLDLINSMGGCDEFFSGRKVNAVKAGEAMGWTADSHMNFLGACFPECLDTIFGGSTANDGVFYYEESPVTQQRAHGIQFYFYMEVPHGLGRLDKSAAHVMVTDYAHFQWNARFLGESKGGIVAGVRKGHNYVGAHLILPGHLVSQPFTGHINILSKNVAVRAGKVDELEDAEGCSTRIREMSGPESIPIDEDHLSRLDVSKVPCPYQIQGTGLRSNHIGVVINHAQAHGAKAVRVAGANDLVFCGDYQRISTFDLTQGADKCLFQSMGKLAGNKVDYYLTVHGCLKDRAPLLQFTFQAVGVDQVSVMSDG